MVQAASKALFQALAQSAWLKRLASKHGMAPDRGFARRFIAGETIEEALGTVSDFPARGLRLTIDYLGESVSSTDAARSASDEYLHILDAMVKAGVERNVSVKLTQLGLDVDRATAVDNMRRILEHGAPHDFFVRIDMEGSAYTAQTLEVVDVLWRQQYRNIGAVIQSCLRRSEDDVRALNQSGIRVRLVKGAYKEPRTVAFQDKETVDAKLIELMRVLLDHGTYPAIATHDPAMIDATKAHARKKGYGYDRFEFQMLFGIRRDLQASLVAEGYRVRVYVPFGRQWYPYFMRRLGERPANIGFVLRAILGERTERRT
jgi:proline dehydrogenase